MSGHHILERHSQSSLWAMLPNGTPVVAMPASADAGIELKEELEEGPCWTQIGA